MVAIKGGPADKTATGRPMRQGDATKLETEVSAYAYLKSARDGFQDDFAGNTLTGRVENWGQRALGTGTPGQADWWANFKTADNIIRNELFGASLTSGEKAAYAETTVEPSMAPSEVKKNLNRRTEIIQKALHRKTGRLHTVYNKEEIEAALGEYAGELLPKGTKLSDGVTVADYTGMIGGSKPEDATLATGETRMEVVRGPVEKKLAAMLANGTPSATIKKYAKDNNYDPGKLNGVLAYRALNPNYKGGYNVGTEKTVPVSAFTRAMASPLATVGLQAANAFTAGNIDEIVGGIDSLTTGVPYDEAVASADMLKQLQSQANPKSALAGNVLGGATAMLTGGAALRGMGIGKGAWATGNPIKAAALGDAAYGAAYGAGENNDNRLLGAAFGAPAALVGSALGAGAMNVGGKVVRGVVSPAAERLRALGIPLTAGEVLGGGWKKMQDAGTSVWGPGNLMSARYGEGREALNRAAFNEAGDVIGMPINQVGQPAIQALSDAKSTAYGNALDPVSLDLTDPQFANDITALGNVIGKIPPNNPARTEAFDTLTHRIKNNMDAEGQMSGRNFQEAYRGLARSPKERSAKDYQTEFTETMQGGKQALADTLERQNPGAYDGFLKANSANRHLSILTDAVNAAKSQVDAGEPMFTPAQLGTAATGNTNKFIGKEASASGNRPFNELINDAQQVMSQKIGDSGTAGRAMFGGAMLGAGGVGYGADGGAGATVGALSPLVIASMLNTKVGQTALTKLLLERIAPFKKAGTYMIDKAPVGGAIGASATLPFIGQ